MGANSGITRRQIRDRQISPKKLYAALRNGSYIEEFFNYQPICTGVLGHAAPSGVDTESFRVHLKNGGALTGTYIGTGTQVAPLLAAGELQLSLDEAASDGVHYAVGITEVGATSYGPMLLTLGSAAPHFLRGKFKVADVSEVTYCAIGYREEGAVAPVFDNYTDLGAIRLDNGNVKIETIENNAATVSLDTLQDVADGVEFELKVVLEGRGVRFFFNGKEYGSKFTFHSSVTRILPFIHLFQEAAGAGSIIWCSELEAGYLADVDDFRSAA